jgi:hypothetical protein
MFMATEPPASAQFELTLLHFEGVSTALTHHRWRSPAQPSALNDFIFPSHGLALVTERTGSLIAEIRDGRTRGHLWIP